MENRFQCFAFASCHNYQLESMRVEHLVCCRRFKFSFTVKYHVWPMSYAGILKVKTRWFCLLGEFAVWLKSMMSMAAVSLRGNRLVHQKHRGRAQAGVRA